MKSEEGDQFRVKTQFAIVFENKGQPVGLPLEIA